MLKDKVIVVTSGAGAIGQCFVRDITETGGIAVAADINYGGSELLPRECLGKIEAVHLDITSKDSITALIADLRQRHGRIDAVINNAYPHNNNYGRKLERGTFSDFCENVNMYLSGYILVAQQFCLAFKEQGCGNVINMSSIYGSTTPRFEVYRSRPMTMPVQHPAIKAAVENSLGKSTAIRICPAP